MGKDLEVYGDPETKTLDFTYVDDFVEGVMLAIGGDWNRAYNISGNEEFKVYELAKMIVALTGTDYKRERRVVFLMIDNDIGVVEICYGNSREWTPVIYVGPDREKDDTALFSEYMIGATSVRFTYNPLWVAQVEEDNATNR